MGQVAFYNKTFWILNSLSLRQIKMLEKLTYMHTYTHAHTHTRTHARTRKRFMGSGDREAIVGLQKTKESYREITAVKMKQSEGCAEVIPDYFRQPFSRTHNTEQH